MNTLHFADVSLDLGALKVQETHFLDLEQVSRELTALGLNFSGFNAQGRLFAWILKTCIYIYIYILSINNILYTHIVKKINGLHATI